jgi:1-deoxy-D-xylulose-5-phosphate reductoisomerase
MQALVLGPKRLEVARRCLGTPGGVERGELAEIPVGRRADQPLVRELDDDERRVGAKQGRDLRDGTVQVVNVVERPTCDDSVEAVLVEVLESRAAKDRAVRRVRIDRSHVEVAAGEVESEAARSASDLKDARRWMRELRGYELGVGVTGRTHARPLYKLREDRRNLPRSPAAPSMKAEPRLPAMRRIALLGATGSIGTQALEIVETHPDLELCALAVGSDRAAVKRLAVAHGVEHVSVDGDPPLDHLIRRSEPNVVLNAVVGFAGLPATLAALEEGIDLALANKESLVAAGDLALATRARGGGRILPVDSEHSAAFQCLEGRELETVDSLVLTASGGPFRGRSRAELASVTPAEALAHPTWRMGPKITVDSATLMNKGLELIEAHYLFGLPYDRIEVVVHPTSVVHALVRFRDGASLAHLGYPDMRVPISYALTYRERAATPVQPLDFGSGLILEFGPPDEDAFPCLALARAAGEAGGTAPCVLNAANEVAVASFLDGLLPFLGIADVVERTLSAVTMPPARTLEELLAVDAEARRVASALTGELVH